MSRVQLDVNHVEEVPDCCSISEPVTEPTLCADQSEGGSGQCRTAGGIGECALLCPEEYNPRNS